MAREYVAVIKDDLTGKVIKDEKDVHTFKFSFNGSSYSLDLGPDTAEQFLTVMDKYTSAATKEGSARAQTASTRAARGSQSAKSDREQLAAMREWLRANGHEVSDRGRIPQHLKDLYNAAN